MRKIFTSIAFFALSITFAFCQVSNDFVSRLTANLKKYSEQHVVEKAYLQFDKPYYAAGDTLFFKAYVTAGQEHVLSNISGILHVDLINSANHIEQRIHRRERLLLPPFSFPQSLHRRLVARVDHQLEAAHALERRDFSRPDFIRRLA